MSAVMYANKTYPHPNAIMVDSAFYCKYRKLHRHNIRRREQEKGILCLCLKGSSV